MEKKLLQEMMGGLVPPASFFYGPDFEIIFIFLFWYKNWRNRLCKSQIAVSY